MVQKLFNMKAEELQTHAHKRISYLMKMTTSTKCDEDDNEY